MNMELKDRKKFTLKKLVYALSGIFCALKTEVNMKIYIVMTVLVVISGFIFHISLQEWFICIILIGLVIGSELMNTAIEATVDLVCEKEHPLAKLAKDSAAGAVLVLVFTAFVIGMIIFGPKLLALC